MSEDETKLAEVEAAVAEQMVLDGEEEELQHAPKPKTPDRHFKVRLKELVHEDYRTGKVSAGNNDDLRWENLYADTHDELLLMWAQRHQRRLMSFPMGNIEVTLLIWGPQSEIECLPYERSMTLAPQLSIIGVSDRSAPKSSLAL